VAWRPLLIAVEPPAARAILSPVDPGHHRRSTMPPPRRLRRGPKPDRRRALDELLAASRDGYTEAIMLAARLHDRGQGRACSRAGLTTATAERMVAGGKSIEGARVKITDAGRRALAERG